MHLLHLFYLQLCWLVLTKYAKYDHVTGDAVNLFAGMDYSSKNALVDYRVKQLAYACIQAVHQNRLVAPHLQLSVSR